MEKEKKQEMKKYLISIVCVIIFLLVTTLYIYYPNKNQLLSSFSFLENHPKFYMEDVSSGVHLAEAYPITDQEGLQNDAYVFKVINETNQEIDYQLQFQNNIDKIIASGKLPLDNKYLRYSLEKEEVDSSNPATLSADGVLDTLTIEANTTQVFYFRVWLTEEADEQAMNKAFIGKIHIEELSSI